MSIFVLLDFLLNVDIEIFLQVLLLRNGGCTRPPLQDRRTPPVESCMGSGNNGPDAEYSPLGGAAIRLLDIPPANGGLNAKECPASGLQLPRVFPSTVPSSVLQPFLKLSLAAAA